MYIDLFFHNFLICKIYNWYILDSLDNCYQLFRESQYPCWCCWCTSATTEAPHPYPAWLQCNNWHFAANFSDLCYLYYRWQIKIFVKYYTFYMKAKIILMVKWCFLLVIFILLWYLVDIKVGLMTNIQLRTFLCSDKIFMVKR